MLQMMNHKLQMSYTQTTKMHEKQKQQVEEGKKKKKKERGKKKQLQLDSTLDLFEWEQDLGSS